MPSERYDVIVVGARCAGAATALLLARMGYQVLCVDRRQVATDTISTHYIHRSGVRALARWSLLDALTDTKCPPVAGVRYQVENISFGKTAAADEDVAYCPRRYILDQLMARAAADAGAEVREDCHVIGILWRGSRVVGVKAVTKSGVTYTAYACVTVGADGVNSTIAKLVQAKEYAFHRPLTCVYYSYWTGCVSSASLVIKNRQAVLSIPTHDDATLMAVIRPREMMRKMREGLTQEYLQVVQALAPALRDRISTAEMQRPIVGTGNLPGYFRVASGPGWALVGDAGHHKDPLPANGISDAWRQAEMLVEHIDAGCQQADGLDRALRKYWETRDQEFMPPYQATCFAARMMYPDAFLDKFVHRLKSRNFSGHFMKDFLLECQSWSDLTSGVEYAK